MAPKYNRKKSTHHTSSKKGGSKTQLYLIIGVIVIVSIIAIAYFAGVFSSNTTGSPVQTNPPASTPVASPNQTPASGNTQVLLQTSMGNITIQLFDDKPITTQNFLNLVAAGKYDNTIFHRVIKGFMIQGGVINENLATINDEIGTNNHNSKYTIAMANTGAPNSASSSFFINTADNSIPSFDSSYTVFGEVVKGKDVVDAIENVDVTASSFMPDNELSQPVQTITLISATIIS
jgi:cyclophilin family peptidyl-prolyl cis-trans isomerase